MTLLPVVVVDCHAIFRAGLRDVLSVDGRYVVVGEAGHLVDALRVIRATSPALVITDYHLAGMTGLDLAHLMLSAQLTGQVVVLGDTTPRQAALAPASVAAIIRRDLSAAELLQVLHTVTSAELSTRFVPDSDLAADRAGLRRIEAAVLDGLSHGLSHRELAEALGEPEPAIAQHLRAAMDKLEAVHLGGLVPEVEPQEWPSVSTG